MIQRCMVTVALLAGLALQARGTHLRSVEIHTRTDCTTGSVEITVIAYVNYFNTGTQFGGAGSILSFGDGSSISIPEISHEVVDADLFIGRVQFSVVHVYPGSGVYKITFTEPNRNAGIVNFEESLNTPFYTEAAFELDAGDCNSSPVLLVSPVDRACTGVAFYHNPGAVDPEGDSLSYELVIPMKASGVKVVGYKLPNEQSFYTAAGIGYDQANEAGDGQPTFRIDAQGTLTWDAPGSPGEYAFAIKIIEHKFDHVSGTWREAGYMIRDMQVIVEDCENRRPQVNAMREVCIEAGQTWNFALQATDPDGHPVVVEAFSEILMDAGSPATFVPFPAVPQSTAAPFDTAAIHFTWVTSCSDVRAKPYQIVIKISDRPPSGPRMVRFYTIALHVIAPAPRYKDVSVNPVSKSVTLKWDQYPCENIQTFQVWRRITEHKYTSSECATGMPEHLRYELIAELDAGASGYTDHDLSFGSQYCYRIVGLLGGQRTASRISIDTCLIPKPAEAPVIVNVSVESTDDAAGRILIRWTSPFDIDKSQYPPPFLYKVFRKKDQDPDSGFIPLTGDPIADTVYLDDGLDTDTDGYSYRVELYVPALTETPVDTSSTASSVFAFANGDIDHIALTWNARTPWSNYAQQYPYHLIYRSASRQGPFILIDSVDVTESGFVYTDPGQSGVSLSSQPYYYKIMTRGSYGNPEIAAPLENLSQSVEGKLLDSVPPCAPEPAILARDCATFACDGSDYQATLTWEAPCADEIVSYEILVRDDVENQFHQLAIVNSTTYVHKDLASLNKCYRVISIDAAGNKSDSSAIVCNSNCINFELPNVITPGNVDGRNDYLTTFTEDRNYCPRSVESVELAIFSRWGDPVFTSSLTGNSKIFWDGMDDVDREVSSGIYFYRAKVRFDTNDVSLRETEVKGWVHVIR